MAIKTNVYVQSLLCECSVTLNMGQLTGSTLERKIIPVAKGGVIHMCPDHGFLA